MLTKAFLVLMLLSVTLAWPVNQPKTNVWITLANLTGQDTLCLAMASPENLFSTCLVGLALDEWPRPSQAHILDSENHADAWEQWVPFLPYAGLEPQEVELLGSVKMDLCVKFNYSGSNQSRAWDVSLNQPTFKNESAWCNCTHPFISLTLLGLHYCCQQECF